MPAPKTLAHRLGLAACPRRSPSSDAVRDAAGDAAPAGSAARSPRPAARSATHRGAVAAVALLAAVGLSACSTPGEAPEAVPITAGHGTCELPTLTVNPATAAPGAKVHLSGKWFVEGCGGAAGLKPLLLMGLSFTDSAGKAQGLEPIDAKGDTGVVEADVTIPADAPGGMGKFILGTSAPVDIMIQR